jgi:hypothetical protein
MEITLYLILLTIIAGFIKGLIGFGLSLILISVLISSGIPPSEFLPILVPLFVILDLFLYFENKKYVSMDLKENFSLHPTTLITLFVGILVGTYILMNYHTAYIKLIFAVLILISIFFLIEKVDLHQMKTPSEKSNGIFGFISGVLTGLFTLNSLPASIYLIFYQYPKEKYMGALVTFLLISDFLLVAIYLYSSLFTLQGFINSLTILGIVLIGFSLGVILRKHISTSKFKAIVILVLALQAIKIIFDFFMK